MTVGTDSRKLCSVWKHSPNDDAMHDHELLDGCARERFDSVREICRPVLPNGPILCTYLVDACMHHWQTARARVWEVDGSFVRSCSCKHRCCFDILATHSKGSRESATKMAIMKIFQTKCKCSQMGQLYLHVCVLKIWISQTGSQISQTQTHQFVSLNE